ncbi:uncharacterized protein LOC128818385 isoform X1 [Vidua macroura]|uniref:uncharacterized protein LOC128818385 isoform X1 n=1 Tax=Vidua macroura TaxID=187451 RepID=UPI0023A836AB|nr:uncharacterized protein LOC128818385 isoform X1 [Vidua macroura]
MAQPRCRSVLITGCSRGIGLGLVRGLAAASPSPDLVFATCRYPEKAQELQQLSKQYSNIKLLQLDVVCENSIKKVVKEVEEIVGDKGLNCLINNAGINVLASLEEVTAETMLTIYETNTVAQLMVTKAFLPLLRKAAQLGTGMGCHRAAIINMSSLAASMQLVQANEMFLKVYPYRIAKLLRCFKCYFIFHYNSVSFLGNRTEHDHPVSGCRPEIRRNSLHFLAPRLASNRHGWKHGSHAGAGGYPRYSLCSGPSR